MHVHAVLLPKELLLITYQHALSGRLAPKTQCHWLVCQCVQRVGAARECEPLVFQDKARSLPMVDSTALSLGSNP